MKEYKFGNTRVIVHSSLLNLSKEERAIWFAKEKEKGNPHIDRLTDIVNDIYRNSSYCKPE